jgi:uncharacterized integral membrane protein
MDALDCLQVVLYRCGFTLACPAVGLLPWQSAWPLVEATLVCATICAANLHIYAKGFRLLLQFATWTALLLAIMGVPAIALGLAFVTLGGVCYKERYCFEIPGLQLQPIILALLWFALAMDLDLAARVLSAFAALLFAVTGAAKWRMPLHFDIGDKSKYQI